jgi:hypothetical protein
MENNEVFEINLETEKGKEMIKLIQSRIEILINNPVIQDRLLEMKQSGKSGEECRDWITILAISTLYGLPKTGDRYNFLAEKLREMAAECAA